MTTVDTGLPGAANSSKGVPPGAMRADPAEQKATFGKIIRHLVPLLFIGYTFAFIDRINVGFAQLQMKTDLGISDAQFGIAASMFFVTYVIFEVPSNMLLVRIGARKQLLRIMILWGITSAATMFVQTPGQLYFARLLLGLFEAGFFPCMILYLSFWLPSAERAKATGMFMVGGQIAGLIGGPVSGLIMGGMHDFIGLRGWQWMFLLEGLPCVFIGLACYYFLSDKPEQAAWLSDREKQLVADALEAERVRAKPATARNRIIHAFLDPRVYLLAFLVLTVQGGGMLINFWLPTMIRGLGVQSMANIGYLTMIPFAVGTVGVLAITYLSDRLKERRFHFAICVLAAAAAAILLPSSDKSLAMTLFLVSIIGIGVWAAIPIFWSLPARWLGKEEAVAGIGVIAALGQFGPFLSPMVIGFTMSATGTMVTGLYAHAAVLILAGLLMLFVVPTKATKVGAEETPA